MNETNKLKDLRNIPTEPLKFPLTPHLNLNNINHLPPVTRVIPTKKAPS